MSNWLNPEELKKTRANLQTADEEAKRKALEPYYQYRRTVEKYDAAIRQVLSNVSAVFMAVTSPSITTHETITDTSNEGYGGDSSNVTSEFQAALKTTGDVRRLGANSFRFVWQIGVDQRYFVIVIGVEHRTSLLNGETEISSTLSFTFHSPYVARLNQDGYITERYGKILKLSGNIEEDINALKEGIKLAIIKLQDDERIGKAKELERLTLEAAAETAAINKKLKALGIAAASILISCGMIASDFSLIAKIVVIGICLSIAARIGFLFFADEI